MVRELYLGAPPQHKAERQFLRTVMQVLTSQGAGQRGTYQSTANNRVISGVDLDGMRPNTSAVLIDAD